jgi:hypothetical protein
MPDGILMEDGTNMVHEGAGQILLEGEDSTLVIPTRTALGLMIGDETLDTGLMIGDETIGGASE